MFNSSFLFLGFSIFFFSIILARPKTGKLFGFIYRLLYVKITLSKLDSLFLETAFELRLLIIINRCCNLLFNLLLWQYLISLSFILFPQQCLNYTWSYAGFLNHAYKLYDFLPSSLHDILQGQLIIDVYNHGFTARRSQNFKSTLINLLMKSSFVQK